MIEQVKISNFQSHKKTELEFHPGVNIIVGPSDSGKTAVLRALRWAIWNRPLGDAFRSSWGGDTIVRIKSYNGILERFKGKEDHYKLYGNPDLEPIEFKAFGTSVPEEIEDHLNLSEINIQNQMDSAFLISSNPGEVSRHFNKIANIDQIDTSLKNIEKWVREYKQNVDSTEQEVERLEEEVKEYKYLDKMEADIEVLEDLDSRLSTTRKQSSDINKLLNSIDEAEEDIKEKSVILSAEDPVNEILGLYEERFEKIKNYKKIKELCIEITSIETQISDNQTLIEDEDLINDILDLYNSISELDNHSGILEDAILNLEKVDENISSKKNHLEDLEEKWHKNMPKVCPLCDQKI